MSLELDIINELKAKVEMQQIVISEMQRRIALIENGLIRILKGEKNENYANQR